MDIIIPTLIISLTISIYFNIKHSLKKNEIKIFENVSYVDFRPTN